MAHVHRHLNTGASGYASIQVLKFQTQNIFWEFSRSEMVSVFIQWALPMTTLGTVRAIFTFPLTAPFIHPLLLSWDAVRESFLWVSGQDSLCFAITIAKLVRAFAMSICKCLYYIHKNGLNIFLRWLFTDYNFFGLWRWCLGVGFDTQVVHSIIGSHGVSTCAWLVAICLHIT